MKKLHLHKLFHWLYAILMLWPFINFICGMAVYWFSGIDFVDTLSVNPWQVFNDECMPGFQGASGIAYDLCHIWEYLFLDVFGWDSDPAYFAFVVNMLSYWVVVSVGYLVFDVLMYIINVAHHWLDAGGDKL